MKKIIIVLKNNGGLFLSYLEEKDKRDFEGNFKKALPSRHSIAHCIPLKKEHYQAIKVSFGDILDMIT